jgi:hypothetical protein
VEEKRLDLARPVLGVVVLLPLVVVAAAGLGLARGVVDALVAMVAGVWLVVRVQLVVRIVAHEVVGLRLALGVANVVLVALVRLVVRMVRAAVAAEAMKVRAMVASKVAVPAVVLGEEARRRLLLGGTGCLPLAPEADSLRGEVYVAVPLGHELPAPLLGYIEALLVESLLQFLPGLFVAGGLLVGAVGGFLGVLGGGQEQTQGLALEGVDGVAQLLIG